MTAIVRSVTTVCLASTLLVIFPPATHASMMKRNPFRSLLPVLKVEKKPVEVRMVDRPPNVPSKPVPPGLSPNPPESLPQPVKSGIINTPAPDSPAPNFQITGLVWNSERPQAIINGEIIEEGGTLSTMPVRVIKIRKDGVDVDFQGQKFTITAVQEKI